MFRKAILPMALAAALLTLAACGDDNNNNNSSTPAASVSPQDALQTATPIKHLVVIYGENVSFDHYFATYPNSTNAAGEPQVTAAANTQKDINTLQNAGLLAPNNPNGAAASPNVAAATINGVSTQPPNVNGVTLTTTTSQPFRLDRTQANTKSQNHSYGPEQLAADNNKMDAFPLFTAASSVLSGSTGQFGSAAQVLGYFDGNTVTGYWNYAQNFAMSDNAWTDTFGPSTPGAVAVVAGQNNGIQLFKTTSTTDSSLGTQVTDTSTSPTGNAIIDGASGFTLIGDLDPAGDVCTNQGNSVGAVVAQFAPTVKNIGDLLNAKNVTWGGFMGGFDLTATNPNGTIGCKRSTFSSVLNSASTDYVQHHAWFQYFPSTANLTHQRPSSPSMIGFTDPTLDNTATPVHHQYDVNDFFSAVTAGNFPSVSFLKAPAVGDGHPGNSDPLDEQQFVVKVVNFLQQQPDWKNTAVVVAYDDSDGWYDHQAPTITHASFDTSLKITASNSSAATKPVFQGADQLIAAGQCTGPNAVQPKGVSGNVVNGRCGPATRTPFLLISPWAKANFVDHTQISQASVVKFIEDNWLGGQRLGSGSFDADAGDIRSMLNATGTTPTVFLDPTFGTKLAAAPTN
ncbi:alkaline phosphatase family protein [Paraburkholderia sp. SARCC-3016]|uniref:phospholipase C n=1 Tax=Paraburkholderia sp. SARCC-3016 TaxID=3058611 RepID=UPI002807E51A|nr:alkaline phosphatase family protein [Paraburkholderia sp. SARCC-3016]MDQ7981746.1 alkaline phosphatase family protein [Paraburkholderia sp. SARCC-3016]